MTPEPDYPAAHSMDTEWFAVDADGHVARFDSGEPGPVPEGACGWDEVSLDELRQAAREAPLSLRDWIGDEGGETHREIPEPPPPTATTPAPKPSWLGRLLIVRDHTTPAPDPPPGLGPTLLFLDSLDRVKEDIERLQWGVTHAPATEGVAVLFEDLPLETAWRLHEAGACLGCFPWVGGGYGGLDDQLPARLGLFTYECDYDEFAPFYTREETPAHPLRLDDLPGPLREAIGRLRFEALRFAEAPRIQPMAHTPCVTWGDFAYLDVDGRTVRPIPGEEDRYREYYEQYAEQETDFDFTPPAG